MVLGHIGDNSDSGHVDTVDTFKPTQLHIRDGSTPSALSSSTRHGRKPTWFRSGAGLCVGCLRAFPYEHWKTMTFLAALRCACIDAPCVFDGPINGLSFMTYVEQFLVPTLRLGDMVILDNAPHAGGPACYRSPAAPSLPMPVRMTPMAFFPAATATELNNISMEGLCPDTRGPSCRRQKCPGSDEFEMNVSGRNVDMASRYARTINYFRQGQGTVAIGPLGEGSYLVARHMGIRRSADDFDPLVASQAMGQQLAHQRRIVGDQGPNWSGWMPAHSKNSMEPLTGSCLRFPCSLLLLTCRRDRLPAQFKHRDLPLTGKYGHLAYLSSRAANKIWSNKVLRS
jgi:hypothetical protein